MLAAAHSSPHERNHSPFLAGGKTYTFHDARLALGADGACSAALFGAGASESLLRDLGRISAQDNFARMVYNFERS